MNVFSKKNSSWIVWNFEGFDLFPRVLWEDRCHFHICELNARLQPKWCFCNPYRNPPWKQIYNPYYGGGMNCPLFPASDWPTLTNHHSSCLNLMNPTNTGNKYHLIRCKLVGMSGVFNSVAQDCPSYSCKMLNYSFSVCQWVLTES